MVDLEGKYFLTSRDKQIGKRIQKRAERKASILVSRANRIKDKRPELAERLNSRAQELRQTVNDITDIKNNQSTSFHFDTYVNSPDYFRTTSVTEYDSNGDAKSITIFTDASIGNQIHEIRHAGQYARGENKRRDMIDLEVDAYKTQFSWKGKLQYLSGTLLESQFHDRDLTNIEILQLINNDSPIIRTVEDMSLINAVMVRDILDTYYTSGQYYFIYLYR